MVGAVKGKKNTKLTFKINVGIGNMLKYNCITTNVINEKHAKIQLHNRIPFQNSGVQFLAQKLQKHH